MASTEQTLDPLFAAFADLGRRVALVQFEAETSSSMSYAKLAQTTARFASGACQAGLSAGDTVLLLGVSRLSWIVACLGALRARAVPVPLDVQLPDDGLQRIVEDSGARWALADSHGAGRLEDAGFTGEIWLLDGDSDHRRHWKQLCGREPESLPAADPGDCALLFYTSGTTGPPKGVPLKHRHIAFQMETLRQADLVRAGDRILQPLPAHHVYPLVVGTLGPLALGLTLVMPHAVTGPQLLRAIREGEVTFILGVPRLYAALYEGIMRRLNDAPKFARITARAALALATVLRRRLHWRCGKFLLASLHRRVGRNLRVLASGGSALDPELAWKLEGMGWQVAIGYGLTETAPLLTLNPPGGNHPDSVGMPVPGIEIRIDPAAHPAAGDEAGEPLDAGEPGVEGEILARGGGVFDGYHNLQQKTEKAFTNGWFRTGDLGRFDEAGRLYVTGRRDTLIVTPAGKNVQPDSIEGVYEQHEAIEEAGVLSVKGELVAVIVPSRATLRGEDAAERVNEAVARQSRTLPSHQRIARFEISRQTLDRTRLGKIQRHRLAQRYAALREGEDAPAPRTKGPAELADLTADDRQLLQDERSRAAWDLLVKTRPEGWVQPDADLRLDLGIDSLGWLDLTMELAEGTGVELGERRIAELEIVRDLLEAMTEQHGGEATDPRALLEDPESALSENQRYWLTPLPRPAAITARCLRALNRVLIRRLFRLQIEGESGIPREGPLVIAPNHASLLDPFAVAAALPPAILESVFWGGWTGIAFRNPLRRGVSRLARAVPVDPERGVVSSLAFAAAVLKNGNRLAWFPEGERSRDGELGDFRPGIGVLLEAYPEVPVVPVHIAGSYQAWPVWRRRPRLRPIRVRFGEPLTAWELDSLGEGDEARIRITRALRQQVAALAAE